MEDKTDQVIELILELIEHDREDNAAIHYFGPGDPDLQTALTAMQRFRNGVAPDPITRPESATFTRDLVAPVLASSDGQQVSPAKDSPPTPKSSVEDRRKDRLIRVANSLPAQYPRIKEVLIQGHDTVHLRDNVLFKKAPPELLAMLNNTPFVLRDPSPPPILLRTNLTREIPPLYYHYLLELELPGEVGLPLADALTHLMYDLTAMPWPFDPLRYRVSNLDALRFDLHDSGMEPITCLIHSYNPIPVHSLTNRVGLELGIQTHTRIPDPYLGLYVQHVRPQ